jgi:hypothetical protein
MNAKSVKLLFKVTEKPATNSGKLIAAITKKKRMEGKDAKGTQKYCL